MKKLLLLFTIVLMGVGVMAQTTYTKVTSSSGLEAGSQYIIVGYNDALGFCAMSYQKTANRHAIQVTEDGGSITLTPATDPSSVTEVFQFTLEGSDGQWSFFDELMNGYLYAASSSSNHLKTQANLDNNGKWVIEFDANGNATVTAQGENTRNIMRFNENSSNGTPLFSCYNSGSSINVPVSFYKAGGAAQIDPEPTNYPTNVWASVLGNAVTIHWVDAIGEQLPSRYLVVGAMGNVTVPVDGNPVADDELAKNVGYGVQQVTFDDLDGNTAYQFAIFPYTNGGANIDYKTDGAYPTVQVTTEQVDVLLFEDFDNDLGMFTEYSVLGDQTWHQGTYGGVTYANMNGYSGGANNANEDWLISPEIPFNRLYDAYVLEFRTAMKFNGEPLRVKVSCDFTGGDPVTDGYWVDITDYFNFSEGDYTWVESGRYDMAEELNNQLGFFHVAFVYTSTDAAANSWEVDYVKVTGETGVSVVENTISNISVFPNPAHDRVSFNLTSDAQVSVFDITGRMVSMMNMAAGQGQYEVADLENGVYFLNIRYADGKKEVARFVKY